MLTFRLPREDKGKTALIVRALYGLKSSGASWRTHIAHTLLDMCFVPIHGDPDVSMRQALDQMTNASYWEYILVYVDDLLAIGMEPRAIFNILDSDYNYVLKDFGPPTRYLGASIGTYDLDDQKNVSLCPLINTWPMPSPSFRPIFRSIISSSTLSGPMFQ
jgi:hypothetical protein